MPVLAGRLVKAFSRCWLIVFWLRLLDNIVSFLVWKFRKKVKLDPFEGTAALKCLIWVWVHRLGRPLDGSTYFRTRINLETILVWLLVFCVRVQGCSRNSSALQTDSWTEKNFVHSGQSARNLPLHPTELLRQFLCQPAFYLLWHLSDIVGNYFRNGCVQWLVLLGVVFLSVDVSKEKSQTVFQTEIFSKFQFQTGETTLRNIVNNKKNTTR